MKQKSREGTWSDGMHPTLPLTCYVTWTLLESGISARKLVPALKSIRTGANKTSDPYALALAANALLTADRGDPALPKVLERLYERSPRQASLRSEERAKQA